MSSIIASFKGKIEDFSLDTSFNIPAQGVTALFGPSGCGKTTILRCIAGLTRMETGLLKINNKIWQNDSTFVPTHKRRIGYVFQEASLFPHLDVEQNLIYGIKRRKSRQTTVTLDDSIQLLGLASLLKRKPQNLSGGERQRVAIGRALLTSPELLLMDEPLAALDQFSKDEILPYLERLKDELQIPIIYVSHDIREIERIADRIILIKSGKIEASGALSELLIDNQLYLSKQKDAATIFEGEILSFDPENNLTTISVNGGEFLIPGNAGQNGIKKRLRVFANDVSLSPEKPSRTTILNVMPAQIIDICTIEESQFNILCQLHNNGEKIQARITKKSQNYFNFQIKNKIFIQIKSVSLINS